MKLNKAKYQLLLKWAQKEIKEWQKFIKVLKKQQIKNEKNK